jgi:BirA family biotin operon repressor/biotin-[acetyl-CoA-carboxylase] ligase
VTTHPWLPAGYTLHAFDTVASTNDEAKRLAEGGAGSGTVVWARVQTSGRGRHGRAWESPRGNLYASVLLRPPCALGEAAALSLVSSLALVEALRGLAPERPGPKVKWPNDVLIGGAKVAGILLESGGLDGGGGSGEQTDWVVIGSGVNLVSWPEGTPYPATSLAAAGYGEVAPERVLEAYLARLDVRYRIWRRRGFAGLRRAWRLCALGIGDPIRLRLADDELQGRFVDLTAAGGLLFEDHAGARREVTAGEVVFGH